MPTLSGGRKRGHGRRRDQTDIGLSAGSDQCGTYYWSKTFSDFLESKGQKVKLYPRDALGGEAEKLDQVSQGLLEISNSDLAKAGSLDPTIFGFYLPFLFEGKYMDQVFRTMNKTDLLAKINAG